MLINTPISLGELIDKISILIVKQKNIVEETKLELINKELSFLQETLSKFATKESFDNYLEDLRVQDNFLRPQNSNINSSSNKYLKTE